MEELQYAGCLQYSSLWVPEWVCLGAGQAVGGRCLVLGSELEQSTPPKMSRCVWSQRPRRPESQGYPKVKLGKQSVVSTEGKRAEKGNKVKHEDPGRTRKGWSEEKKVLGKPQTMLDCPWPRFMVTRWVVHGPSDSKEKGREGNVYKQQPCSLVCSSGPGYLMFLF